MRIIFIPVGLIRKLLSADEQKSKTIIYVVLGATLYLVLATILFVLLGSGQLGTKAAQFAMPVCGSAAFAMLIAVIGLVVTISEKSEPVSSATWLSIADAASVLHMSDSDVLGLIKSGKLMARKVDGKYRLDKELVGLFAAKNAG